MNEIAMLVYQLLASSRLETLFVIGTTSVVMHIKESALKYKFLQCHKHHLVFTLHFRLQQFLARETVFAATYYRKYQHIILMHSIASGSEQLFAHWAFTSAHRTPVEKSQP